MGRVRVVALLHRERVALGLLIAVVSGLHVAWIHQDTELFAASDALICLRLRLLFARISF